MMDAQRTAHNRDLYWNRTRNFTFTLVAIWFSMTFGIIYFARELNGFMIFGWPFSFYMAAQGLTLLYVLIVAGYAWRMHRMDKILKSESDAR
jgi:putative solute:sodium symporter small subunit